MIIASIITRGEARKRIKNYQSAYAIIRDWDGIVYFDLLNEKLCKAFLKRFPKKEEWLWFASNVESKSVVDEINAGKYLICNTKLTQYKTVRTLYKNFGKSEEDLERLAKEFEEKLRKMDEEEKLAKLNNEEDK